MTLDKETVRAANRLEDIFPALLGVSLNGGKGREPSVPCFLHKDGSRPNLRVNLTTQLWFCDVCQVGGDVFKLVELVQHVDFPAALRWLADRSLPVQTERRIVATYDYQDERRALVYQVVRYEPKDLRQRRPNGKGGWIWKMKGVPQLVYRRPDLTGREAVAIVGGEKDADALWALGLPATTNSGGETKWSDIHTAQLTAAGVQRVVILPDNDDTGRAHAEIVARSCAAADLVVRALELPNLPSKGDVSDYLVSHGRQDLVTLLRAAPLWTPAVSVPTTQPAGAVVICMADVEPEDISWVWSRRLAKGKLTLLVSDGGVGNANATGTDTLTFKATDDGLLQSNEGSVTVTITPPTLCATNITATVALSQGSPRLDRKTGHYTQTVTLRNSDGPISGPVSLVLDNLSGNAVLANGSGTTSCASPLGSSYINVNVGSDVLFNPRERATVTLQFANPSGQPITYTPRVLGGVLSR